MIVQVCEIYLVGRVVATSAYAPVVASPFGTELLPALPGFLRGITAVAGAEHLPQLFGNFSLVAVPHAADDVAFEVGGATLKGGAGEYLAHDIVQTLQAVGAQEAYPFQPLSCRPSRISFQPVALSVGLLHMPRTSRVLSSFTARMT